MQERNKLGHETKRSLHQDHENWWLQNAEKMESTVASDNSAKRRTNSKRV